MLGAREYGFTIIEVMFFLAISGLMVVGLLSATGVTIQRQRYSDSITSTQAFIQQQYTEVSNVVNARSGGHKCSTDDAGQAAIFSADTDATNPGQSNDCVILGRAIDLPAANSSMLTAYNVIGIEPSLTSVDNVYGSALFKAYKLGVDTTNPITYDIPWGATYRSSHPAGINRILLLRSPSSLTISSYAYDKSQPVATGLDAGEQVTSLCIGSADITNTLAALTITPASTSESVSAQFDLSQSDRQAKCQ